VLASHQVAHPMGRCYPSLIFYYCAVFWTSPLTHSSEFARPPPDLRNPQAIRALSGTRPIVVPQLSSFAQTVMDKADVSYRCKLTGLGSERQTLTIVDPTPETPPPRSRHSPAKSKSSPKRASQAYNGVVHDMIRVKSPKDARLVSPPNETQFTPPLKTDHTEIKTPIQRKASATVSANPAQPAGPAVFIPALPSSSQRADYQEYPDIDKSVTAGVKRKRDPQDSDKRINVNIGQREKADAALQTLKATLHEVFQAEENLQSTISGGEYSDTSLYFIRSAYNDDDTPVLTRNTQARLEAAIQKVVGTSCFDEVPMDSLTHLQKLCESTVSCIEALSLTVDEDANEGDVEEWVQRLELAENGLQGARIVLRTMTAGREEKQLYSEDMLMSILTSLECVVDLCIIPVVETRRSASLEKLFQIYLNQKKPITSLLHMSSRVVRMLGDLILNADISEQVVFKVESLSTRLIFVENPHTEKESALGTQRFETMRRGAMDALAKIFARRPEQRNSIFTEILSSLEKLPSTRQSARQFKMPEGKPIQLVSALLMRLVQTSGARSLKNKSSHESRTKDVAESDEDDEDKESDVEGSPIKRVHHGDFSVTDELEPEEAQKELNMLAMPLKEGAWKDANYVVNYLVQRALKSTKSGDQPYRNLLDIFTEDFISVLGLPDWPAAELLLRVLCINMIQLMEDDKRPVPAKNLALDVMGVMGAGISDLKNHLATARKALDSNWTKIVADLVDVATDLDAGEECDMLWFQGPYRVVIEYLHAQGLSDPQTQSARGYLLGQWAMGTLTGLKKEDGPEIASDLPLQLRNMLIDSDWLHNE
jgi:cohesin loading factor subunit SCC2